MNEASINFMAGGLSANAFWLFSMPAEGSRGFYKGLVPCLLRSFPTNASAIMVFEYTMRFLKNSEMPTF
ncbi:11625_t:CDS:2 [Dentiscutata erythropus]|nr:11625_t:CDS:2 [Dentiscutata erythropus]